MKKHTLALGLLLFVLLSCSKKDNTAPQTPKRKYITKFVINQIQWTDPSSGDAWDLTSGPDLFMKFGPSGTNSHSWGRYDDVKQTDLPITVDLASQNIELTDQEWQFTLWEYDSPDPDDLMQQWTFNPASKTSPIALSGNSNSVYDIKIYFDER